MQYQGYTHNSAALDFDSFVFEAGYLDDEEDISGESTAFENYTLIVNCGTKHS